MSPGMVVPSRVGATCAVHILDAGRGGRFAVKLPKDIEARCLELAGEKPAARARRAKPEMVDPSADFGEELGSRVWVIPFECVNETNERGWKGKNRRAGAAWRAVRQAVTLLALSNFEFDLKAGRVLRAKFTRLGGKRLDRLVNLPASVKGVEDAFCYLLGVDDGSPQWRPECDQEPGGKVGVRVELYAERT
jgi:hypothetical protein